MQLDQRYPLHPSKPTGLMNPGRMQSREGSGDDACNAKTGARSGIRERRKTGAFRSVEGVLIQALRASPAPDEKAARRAYEKSSAMGSMLVEAMQASPLKEIELVPGRERMPVRDVEF